MTEELIIKELLTSDKKVYKMVCHSLSNSETIYNSDNKVGFSFVIDDEDLKTAKVISVEESLFSSNLQMVDSKMPEILSSLLLINKVNNENRIEKLLDLLIEINPIGIDSSYKKIFYQKKITDLLTDCALGLDDKKVWKGSIEATSGLIILKSKESEQNIFIYNKRSFQDYLIKSSYLQVDIFSKLNQRVDFRFDKYYRLNTTFNFILR
jgi:type II restriction enzyme